jgi:RNA polymerase sigma-70 factor (ECF subfamily)
MRLAESDPAGRAPPRGPRAAVQGADEDAPLVARVLAGDLAAFELIMRRHNPRLYRVARSILRDASEAEDVVQEAYVRCYEHLAEFRGGARFSTWLTRIALHEALSRRRKARRTRTLEPASAENQRMTDRADNARAEEEASRPELRTLLSRAIDSLPQQMRTVFILREVQGLDTAETAACLEMTTANVKVRLHRARSLLRAGLDEAMGHETRSLHLFDGQRCDRIVSGVMARLRGAGDLHE